MNSAEGNTDFIEHSWTKNDPDQKLEAILLENRIKAQKN